MVSHSKLFYYLENLHVEVLQPPNKFGFGLIPVRSSLTKGITYVFFSSGYLDISVPQLTILTINSRILNISIKGVTPFGHRRIKAS